MVVTERPGDIEGTAPDSPEMLFPEARHRRRSRWLISGAVSIVIVVTGVMVLLFVGGGGGTPVALSPAADHLLLAVHTTEAAKTAATTVVAKITAPPSLRTRSGGVTVGFVRFLGPVEQLGFPSPENRRSPITYCFGHTEFLREPTGWSVAGHSSEPCSPLAPLTSWIQGGAPVTVLKQHADKVTEYLVRRPASVGVHSTNVYVWLDAKGRIVRMLLPDSVTERPSSRSPGFVNVTFYQEVTLSNFGVSFDPPHPKGPFARI